MTEDEFVCLYDGAYGTTIRLSLQKRESLERLKDALRSLMSGVTGTFDLTEAVLGAASEREVRILAEVVSRQRGKALSAVPGQRGVFLWRRAPEGWEHCVGLVEGLLLKDKPGHQYLTDEGTDDALIEVAYRE